MGLEGSKGRSLGGFFWGPFPAPVSDLGAFGASSNPDWGSAGKPFAVTARGAVGAAAMAGDRESTRALAVGSGWIFEGSFGSRASALIGAAVSVARGLAVAGRFVSSLALAEPVATALGADGDSDRAVDLRESWNARIATPASVPSGTAHKSARVTNRVAGSR